MTSSRENQLEQAAMGSSLLCLLHCLAVPVLLLAVPASARAATAHEGWFHVWVLVFAVPASGAALWIGRARHGTRWPLSLGLLGLALLTVGALPLGGTAGEAPATVLGSVALLAAHLGNWRLRHRQDRPAPVA